MRNEISEKLKNFEMHENPTLQAYYYGFDRTGVKVIDSILSAVAMAGKGYHNTDCWSDVCDFLGFSYTELIQEMANRAAKERDDLRAQNAELLEALKPCADFMGSVAGNAINKAEGILANPKK